MSSVAYEYEQLVNSFPGVRCSVIKKGMALPPESVRTDEKYGAVWVGCCDEWKNEVDPVCFLTQGAGKICNPCLQLGRRKNGVPKGIRTPVAAVKGQCPRPLDERDVGLNQWTWVL